LVGVLLLLGISPSTASARTSGWLAAKVAEDGSVVDPYGTEPSIDWTVNTALALASSGDQPEALAKTLGYISSHVEAYIASGTSDPAGHLSWLILLAVATGGDPSAFGTTHIDLPARLATRLGVSETGLYGIVDDYTPVTNQSLAILALIGSQHSVDPAVLGWLLSQQCSGPTGQQGAWQGHRMAATPGPLADCLATTSSEFNRPDVASTAYAVMALAAVRDDGIVVSGLDEAIASGLAWLHSMQAVAGVATGGFGQYVGDAADPNSTALAILALRSADIDPGTWTVGAANPVSSLDGWVISSGADAGALASPYSSGEGDLFATFQGLWGQAQRPFPFAPAQIDDPSREPVAGRAEDGVVTPVFTG
jgi:hypothetical protein